MIELNNTNNPNPRQINSIALEAFFNICKLWSLKSKEQMILLGLEDKSSTFYKWKEDKSGILHKDTLERISYIIGIYKALQILFRDVSQANVWIKKPNRVFSGKSALAVMLGGNVVDIAVVRDYLDAQRGW